MGKDKVVHIQCDDCGATSVRNRSPSSVNSFEVSYINGGTQCESRKCEDLDSGE